METNTAKWTFDVPCKNAKVKRKDDSKPPENTNNFFVRKENFGTLYYPKSRGPLFSESYFVKSEPGFKFILSSPILAILEITGKCNLDCIHCYRPEEKKDLSLELNTVKNLIREFKDMKVVGVQYIGGEPFLHEDLIEMLKESKRNGLKNEVITNGYNIKKSLVEESSDLIDVVSISIDGKKEAHNKIRQTSDSFESALKALREFSERGVYTAAVTTLNKLNYGDVEEVYTAVSDQGADELFLKRMIPIGRGETHKDLYLTEDNLTDLESRVKRVLNNKTKVKFGARCSQPKEDSYTFFGCPGGRTQVVIDCDENVYRCLYKKDFNSYMGNIHNDTFREIWDKNNKTLKICDCLQSDRCGGLCSL